MSAMGLRVCFDLYVYSLSYAYKDLVENSESSSYPFNYGCQMQTIQEVVKQ